MVGRRGSHDREWVVINPVVEVSGVSSVAKDTPDCEQEIIGLAGPVGRELC